MAQGFGRSSGGAAVATKKGAAHVVLPRPAPRVQSPPVTTVSPGVVRTVQRLQAGAPLPVTTRERMESSFGRSFENVRVHTDAPGTELADATGADAVTVGERMAFRAGAFRPETPAGDHLIAHELAHVAQGGASSGPAAPQARLSHSLSSEPAELGAEGAASAVSRGERVQVSPVGGASSTRSRLMRQVRAGASLPALAVSTPVPGTGALGPEESERDRRKREDESEGEASGVFTRAELAAPAAAPPPSGPGDTASATEPASAAKVVVEPAEQRDSGAVEPASKGAVQALRSAAIEPEKAAAAEPAEQKAEEPATEDGAREPTEEEAPASATASAPEPTEEDVAAPATEASAAEPVVTKEDEAAEQAVVAQAPAGAPTAGAAPAADAPSGTPPTVVAAAAAAAPSAERTTEVQAVAAEAAAGEQAAASEPAAGPSAGPGEKAPSSPEEDPAFQGTIARVRAVAERQGHNNPARRKALDALGAASGAPNEVSAQAKAAQVDEMNSQEPAAFDAAGFEEALVAKIDQLMPRTFEDADEFKEQGKAGSIKNAVRGQVSQGKEGAGEKIEQATAEAPDPGVATPKQVTPLPATDPGAPPPGVGAESAAPKAKAESEVTFEKEAESLDQKLSSAGVTEAQLTSSNEPDFVAAVDGKTEAQAAAKENTTAFRANESGTIAASQSGAAGLAVEQTGLMHQTRGAEFGAIVQDQEQAKGADTQKRTEFATKVEGIYETTRTQVQARLGRIDGEADSVFDKGAEQAKSDFESSVDREVLLFKLERYTGADGLILLARDLLLDPPPEVDAIFARGRQRYINQMRGVVAEVAQIVAVGLNEAKALIAGGLRQVAEFVAQVPEEERALAEEAAGGIQGKFDGLRKEVDQRRDQLVDRLAQKYVDNLKAIDADLDQRREEQRGLVSKAGDAIQGVLDTISGLKEMLLGVLAKGAEVIEQIIRDPVGFLGNLVAGIGQGLSNFVANIAGHLKKGFMDWLFGQVAAAGLKLPESFDLKGIFSLVTQVLGATYAGIRTRAVRLLGEPVVSRLEQVAEIFQILMTQGVGGVWEFVKGQVGDLKSLVLDTIQQFVIEKVIVGGIEFLLSLLTPASAFVKAVKMIIQIVQFIVSRGAQIASLVSAVIDSLAAIASGSVGAVAAAVEGALARAIPVAIGFLMSLLGLGGIGDKIKSTIDALRGPLDKAIDFLINLAVKAVKAAGKFISGLGSKKEPAKEAAPEAADPQVNAKIQAGLLDLDQRQTERSKGGGLSPEDAVAVAADVKAQHPVFKSIRVEDDGKDWKFAWSANPTGVDTAPKRLSDDQKAKALFIVNAKSLAQTFIFKDKTIIARADEIVEARLQQHAEMVAGGTGTPLTSVTGKDDVADALALQSPEVKQSEAERRDTRGRQKAEQDEAKLAGMKRDQQALMRIGSLVHAGNIQKQGIKPVVEIPFGGTNRYVVDGGDYEVIISGELGGIAARLGVTHLDVLRAFVDFVVTGTFAPFLDLPAQDRFTRTRRLLLTVETNRISTNLADVALAIEQIELRVHEGEENPFNPVREIPAAPVKAVKSNQRAAEMAAGKNFRAGTKVAERAEDILQRHLAHVDDSTLGPEIESLKPFGAPPVQDEDRFDAKVKLAAKAFVRLIRARIFGETP